MERTYRTEIAKMYLEKMKHVWLYRMTTEKDDIGGITVDIEEMQVSYDPGWKTRFGETTTVRVSVDGDGDRRFWVSLYPGHVYRNAVWFEEPNKLEAVNALIRQAMLDRDSLLIPLEQKKQTIDRLRAVKNAMEVKE